MGGWHLVWALLILLRTSTRNGAGKPISEQTTLSLHFKFSVMKPNRSKQTGRFLQRRLKTHPDDPVKKKSKKREEPCETQSHYYNNGAGNFGCAIRLCPDASI
jgi:hypothetical protein